MFMRGRRGSLNSNAYSFEALTFFFFFIFENWDNIINSNNIRTRNLKPENYLKVTGFFLYFISLINNKQIEMIYIWFHQNLCDRFYQLIHLPVKKIGHQCLVCVKLANETKNTFWINTYHAFLICLLQFK